MSPGCGGRGDHFSFVRPDNLLGAALTGPQLLDRRIAALPEREFNPLQNKIVNLAALFEGGLAQGLVDRLGQIEGLDDIRRTPTPLRLCRCRRAPVTI